MDKHKIERINSYVDERFDKEVLSQHGAFLVDGEYRCQFVIIGNDSATVKADNEVNVEEVIDEFRFYTEHITKFYDINGKLIAEFSEVNKFKVNLSDIQPSQFYVDAEKVKAIGNFIKSPEDIIIPVIEYKGRYASLDGHTRFYSAYKKGFKYVYCFVSKTDNCIFDFIKEAEKRKITAPEHLELLSHAEYEVKWNKFCDDYSASLSS